MDNLLLLPPELWYPIIKRLSVMELIYLWKLLGHYVYIKELFFVNHKDVDGGVLMSDENYPNLYEFWIIEKKLQDIYHYEQYISKNATIYLPSIFSMAIVNINIYLLNGYIYRYPDKATPFIYKLGRMMRLHKAIINEVDDYSLKKLKNRIPKELFHHFILMIYVFPNSLDIERRNLRSICRNYEVDSDLILNLFDYIEYRNFPSCCNLTNIRNKLPKKYQTFVDWIDNDQVDLSNDFCVEEIWMLKNFCD